MAVAIGVVNRLDGSVTLLPDAFTPLSAETGIIVVAEDDDAYACLDEGVAIDVGELPVQRPARARPAPRRRVDGQREGHAARPQFTLRRRH